MASPEDILARKIEKVYQQAAREVKKKIDDFEKAHKIIAERMKKQVEDGKITEKDYQDWLRNQVFTGKRWQEKLDDITKTYVNADAKAHELINGTRKDVFVDFANDTAKNIENHFGAGVSFELYDRKTVERLMRKDPKMLPEWKIDQPKDYTWNEKRVRNAVTQGIIQGESVYDIGKRMTEELAAQNYKKMDMFARTAVTGAQNAGRMEMLHEAQDMGIEVRKKWLSSHDDRVRDTHVALDGQEKPIDEPFEVDGMQIDYPGDPSAPPELTYNCRCTLIYVYPKYEGQKTNKESSGSSESKEKTPSKRKEEKVTSNDLFTHYNNRGIIETDLQLFADRDINKQTDKQLQKGIMSYKQRIIEHNAKIENPKSLSFWEGLSELEQEGLIRHWKHELKTFERNIKDREEELRKRSGH